MAYDRPTRTEFYSRQKYLTHERNKIEHERTFHEIALKRTDLEPWDRDMRERLVKGIDIRLAAIALAMAELIESDRAAHA